MLSLKEIFLILIIHFLGDFVLQTDKQAKGKSKNWSNLLEHTLTYSMIFLVVGFIATFYLYPTLDLLANNLFNCLYFAVITFFLHTTQDYFTSRLNSKLWAKGDTHNFFVSVGFDQVLHYTQLFLTYYLLK